MLVVLPPSETKVSGGQDGTRLQWGALSFPAQNPTRQILAGQLVELSADLDEARRALGLGPKGDGEIVRNRELMSSPTLPALSRYTGILYDALDVDTLPPASRTWALEHVAVFSALFGAIRASDPIPAYRLSWDSALPSGKPQVQWASVAGSLWDDVPGFILDLRSEGYRSLAPLPQNRGVWVNLVRPGALGARKPLGHANKATKGRITRALALGIVELSSVAELVAWGNKAGFSFDHSSYRDGQIDVVVSGS